MKRIILLIVLALGVNTIEAQTLKGITLGEWNLFGDDDETTVAGVKGGITHRIDHHFNTYEIQFISEYSYGTRDYGRDFKKIQKALELKYNIKFDDQEYYSDSRVNSIANYRSKTILNKDGHNVVINLYEDGLAPKNVWSFSIGDERYIVIIIIDHTLKENYRKHRSKESDKQYQQDLKDI